MKQKIEIKGFRKNVKVNNKKELSYSCFYYKLKRIKYNNNNISFYKLRKYLSEKYINQSFDLYYKELSFYSKQGLIDSYEEEKKSIYFEVVDNIIVRKNHKRLIKVNILPLNKELIKEICDYSNEMLEKGWRYNETDFNSWSKIDYLKQKIERFKIIKKEYISNQIDENITVKFGIKQNKIIYKCATTEKLIVIYNKYLKKIDLSTIEYSFLMKHLKELLFWLFLEKCINDNYVFVSYYQYKIYKKQLQPLIKFKKVEKITSFYVPKPQESSTEKKKRLKQEKKELELENLAIAKRHGFDENSFVTNRTFIK